jgi:hypothetical protein
VGLGKGGLGIAIIGLAAGVGWIVWKVNQPVPRPPTEEEPRLAPPPSVPPQKPADDGSKAPGLGRVQIPSNAPLADASSAAIASGRVRGQIDVAPGSFMPGQFELLVDEPGSPTKHFVFPGTERLVTIDVAQGRSMLSARAEGLASHQLVLERASDTAVAPFRLVLEPAGRLNGEVHDARGNALAGLPVALVATNSKEVRTVASDSAGRYAFADIPVGSYRVAFGASDSPIAPMVAADIVQNEVREVPPQNMPDLGEGEVRVLDRASKPVLGARVFGAGQAGGWIDGVSDENGIVRARFLPAGTFFLNVSTDSGRTGQGPLEVNIGRIGRAVIHIRD